MSASWGSTRFSAFYTRPLECVVVPLVFSLSVGSPSDACVFAKQRRKQPPVGPRRHMELHFREPEPETDVSVLRDRRQADGVAGGFPPPPAPSTVGAVPATRSQATLRHHATGTRPCRQGWFSSSSNHNNGGTRDCRTFNATRVGLIGRQSRRAEGTGAGG